MFAGLILPSAIPAATSRLTGPSGSSFTGNFAADDDKREFFFSLASPGTVRLQTFSYAGGTNAAGTSIAAGGFDPTIAVYDSAGNTVAINRDGACGSVARDPVTSSCWDSFLSLSLPAGNYRAVLTQSDNIAAGPALADSFLFNGQGNFTQPPPGGAPGFWDYYPSRRTSFYALDIVGADSAAPPSITSSATAPSGIAGLLYTPFSLTAVGGGPITPFVWTVIPGGGTTGLPAGMSLSPGGILQGTPAARGTYNFIVNADDGIEPVQQTVTLAVFGPVVISTTSLPGGTVGQPYGPVTFAATGGAGAYAWTATGLPADLTLSTGGLLSGIPGAVGSSMAVFTVTDAGSGQIAMVTIPISIAAASPPPPSPLLISGPAALGGVAVGSPISASFSASGGTSPYTWSATNLPAGLNLNAGSGALTGAVATPGNYSFTVKVTDAQPVSTSLNVTLPVLGFATSALPAGTAGVAYSASFTAAGGTPGYSFLVSSIPAGLSLSSAGMLSGTIARAGSYPVNVIVTDSAGVSAPGGFTLTIAPAAGGPLSVPGGSLMSGTVNVTYSDSLSGGGGKPSYTWSLIGGSLPGGLSLNASGAVTGTPSAAGSYSFTGQATDSTGATAAGAFTISIAPAPLTFSLSGVLPKGVLGSDYPAQIFTASGGTLPYSFAITAGSLPDGLALSGAQITGIPNVSGSFTFTLTVTDGASKTASAALSLNVDPAQADLIISQTSLGISLMTGSSGLPTADSITVRSSVIQQLLNYTVSVAPAVSWLSVAGGGTTPGSIGISITNDALSLAAAAAPYTTVITVACVAPSPCAGRAQTINVALSVSAPPPQLGLTQSFLSFASTTSNPVGSSQSVGLVNAGAGTLGITSVSSPDSWISFTGVPGSVASGPAVPISVTVDPTGVSPGYHRSTVTVVSSGGTSSFAVGLLVTPIGILSLNPTGLLFDSQTGSAPGNPSGSFQVALAGLPTAAWSASVLPGTSWLTLTTAGGTTASGSPATVNFSIDPTAASALAPGAYYGVIRVTSGTVVDSPQDFEVVLNVTKSTDPAKPEPSPAGVVFVSGTLAGAVTGTQTQTVQIFTGSKAALPYQASASTADSAGWLSVSPATGTASSAVPGLSTIQINPSGLTIGVYRGGVSYAFSSAAVRTVNITLIVQQPTGIPTPMLLISDAAGSCTPVKLVPTQTGLVSNFAQPTGWPTPLSIKLVDDCGSSVTNGQIVATFSNGDPPLALVAADSSSGVYSGTWTPRSISQQVSISARATAKGFPAAIAQIAGEVTQNSAPILTPNATLHVYDPLLGGALGPGSIVQIYGQNLAAAAVPAPSVPLSTNLGGTSVIIGGVPAPLYYVSPNQVNAQIPFELSANRKYQIVLSANGALTTPDSIQLSDVSPGIAAFASGQIIAQHIIPSVSLVTEAAPAKTGEIIVFYLAGLGATDNTVASGAASPGTQLARPVDPPVLTLNGNSVPVLFAGLTPGLVGLYQVNFMVPANAPEGDLQLVVTQNGVASNPTILPVRK